MLTFIYHSEVVNIDYICVPFPENNSNNSFNELTLFIEKFASLQGRKPELKVNFYEIEVSGVRYFEISICDCFTNKYFSKTDLEDLYDFISLNQPILEDV